MEYIILAINPGSTSTKIAIYKNEAPLFVKTLRHSSEEIGRYAKVSDQFQFRKDLIVKAVEEEGVKMSDINAIVGRGGLVKPIESGVYEVNEALKNDLINPPMGEHASNLGGLIAADIAKDIPGARAFIADPVVVDEMEDVARMTGLPELPRVSIFHALNQKAIGRAYAKSVGKKYEELNLVIAHLGGGISIGAHRLGRVVDVNNALDGEGPFSPERAGSLPVGALVKMCFSGKYTLAEIKKMINGKGGMVAHVGTNSSKDISDRAAAGDAQCAALNDALIYNIAKMIGSMSVVLRGKVDAILITGGIAYDKYICAEIEKMVSTIAPVKVYPGEDEMGALAENGLNVLTGEVAPKEYK